MQCKQCRYYQHVRTGKRGADRGICMLDVKGKVYVYGNCKVCSKYEVKVVNIMEFVGNVKESDKKGSKFSEYISGGKSAIEYDNSSKECSWKMHRCPNCGLAFHYGIPECCPNCKKMMRR